MKTYFSAILVLILSFIIVGITGNGLKDIEYDCGPVENLTIFETELFIGARWDPPVGEDCSDVKMYNVTVITDGEIKFFQRYFRDTIIEFHKRSCTTYAFGVQTIQPFQSRWLFEYKTSGIAGSGDVQNLQLTNEDGMTLTWTAPENTTERCDINYIVNIDTEGFKSIEKTVSTTNTEISLIPCGIHSISVTTYLPQSSIWKGNPVTISETGPMNKKLPPVHASTWPNLTGANVNWIEQEEDNACETNGIEFDYVLTKLKDIEEPSVQVFKISDDSWYKLDDLEEYEEYSYRARWRFDADNSEDDNLQSQYEENYIHFLTKKLTPPVIESVNSEDTSDGDGLRIQWSQSYPDSFITKHIIVVKDKGCIVPESCDNDEELLEWTLEGEANDKTVIVSPVPVNHRYYIEVQTIFGNLNAFTTDSTIFDFEKEIEDPGKIIEVSGTKVTNWTMRFSVLDSKYVKNLIEHV